MNTNPNNPPPQGYGVAFWNWVLSNILFIKRRLNGISGGGGGSQDLQSVTDIGATTTNVMTFTTPDGNVIQLDPNIGSPDFYITTPDGGASIYMQVGSDAGGYAYLDLSNVFGKSVSLQPVPGLTNANIQLLQDASGTIALTSDVDTRVPYTGATGTIDVNSHLISSVATPVSSGDATNKSYVDGLALGLKWKDLARLATTAALPVGTYANGASGVGATFTVTALGTLTVDSVLTVLNDRILVKNQVSTLQNGIYKVTTVGTAGVAAILTRVTDADTNTEITSAAIAITAGTVNANTAFTQTTANPTMGTDPILWSQFLNNAYTPGTGMRLSGNVFYSTLSEGVTGGQTAIGGTGANDTFTIQGSVSPSARTTIDPAFIMNSGGSLTSTSLAQVFASVPFTVNQASGTGGYTGLKMVVTETAVGSGTKNFIDLGTGAGSKFSVANTGTITVAAGANHFAPNINAQTGTTYTFVLTDNEGTVTANNASPQTYTLSSATGFPVGARIDVVQKGAGKVTIAASGVIINSVSGNKAIAAQYGGVSLFQESSNVWYLFGALIA